MAVSLEVKTIVFATKGSLQAPLVISYCGIRIQAVCDISRISPLGTSGIGREEVYELIKEEPLLPRTPACR